MPKYLFTYAYDTPSYVDFVVEAPNKVEAMTVAKAALKKGCFAQVAGRICYDNVHDDRVFECGMDVSEGDPTMEELEGFVADPLAPTKEAT